MEIRRGFTPTPERIVVYGPEGVGKSTFASRCPGVVFIGTEDGGGDLDIAALPTVTEWPQVFEQVEWLANGQHDFTTVALDTIDHLEKLCWRWLTGGSGGIEDVGGGYGKGYTAAAEEMNKLMAALDRLRNGRKMRIIALAHAEIKPFKNPDGPDYDRWSLRMHKATAAAWKEWCDVLLFADYDVKVVTQQKGNEERKALSRGKALGEGGARRIYTTRMPAYDAKNRFQLPEELALEWDAFAKAMGPKLWSSVPDCMPGERHPSFTDKEAKAFATALGNILKVKYDDLAAWLETDASADARAKLGVPASRPSAWAVRLRKQLFSLLESDQAIRESIPKAPPKTAAQESK